MNPIAELIAKLLMPQGRGIQSDPRFDNRGFSESSPQDSYIFDRSEGLNPSSGLLPVSPRYDFPPSIHMLRQAMPIRQRGA